MIDLSEKELTIVNYMIDHNNWQSATRIGIMAGEIKDKKNAHCWSIGSLKTLVKKGYLSHVKASGLYRIKSHVVMQRIKRKKGVAEKAINKFLNMKPELKTFYVPTR